MSPEISYIDKQGQRKVVSVPDVTGTYDVNGQPWYVNVDGIDAYTKTQKVVLECEALGGKRVVGLTLEGRGKSSDPKRGDGLDPELHVLLHERPIRISYQDKPWIEERWVKRSITLGSPRERGYCENGRSNTGGKRTYRNPYWDRKNGRG